MASPNESSSQISRVVLPENYYHTHFLSLVQTVLNRYSDTFHDCELEFIRQFLLLPEQAQKLFIRLINRSGKWFVVAKLNYPEIGNCFEVSEFLQSQNFLRGAATADAGQLLEILDALSIPEIKRCFPKIRKATNRSALVGAVLAGFDETAAMTALVRNFGPVVQPCQKELMGLVQFLYFGNSGQSMTDFVLSDMGLMRYESYSLCPATRAFSNRVAIDDTVCAIQTLESLYEALEVNKAQWSLDALQEARDVTLSRLQSFHPRARRRLCQTLNLLGNRLERQGALGDALLCYEPHSLPPARERCARIHEKTSRPNIAEELALDILRSSRDEAELSFAYRYLIKTAKREHADIPLPQSELEPMRAFLASKNAHHSFLHRNFEMSAHDKPLGVEEVALRAFCAEGYSGVHAENLVWCALFGIVFWPCLFAEVVGAFHHPFQAGPADGMSPDFFARRGDMCTQILAAFETGETTVAALHDRWRTKCGIVNVWVAWQAISWETMQALLENCPRTALRAVLERMLLHPGRFRSGFPDLFLWRSGEAEFWEVKGPGDQLRPQQKSWIAFLQGAGIRAGVCTVSLCCDPGTMQNENSI